MGVVDEPLAVEIEIEQEKASTLGRMGRRLRACVERVRELEAEWTAAPEALHQWKEYRRSVERAHRYKYYLIVQREAVGLTAHHDVDRLFPIPPLCGPEDSRKV